MKTTLIINRNTMGAGDDVLGARILQTLLNKAGAALRELETIVFYNGGVHLLVDGSSCLQALTALHDAGVELVACGTCVDHFGLRERVRVGTIGGMEDILKAIEAAEKVVTL